MSLSSETTKAYKAWGSADAIFTAYKNGVYSSEAIFNKAVDRWLSEYSELRPHMRAAKWKTRGLKKQSKEATT